MAAKRKAVVPPRIFTELELEQLAREVVSRAPGLSGSDFKKELSPDYKKAEKGILEAANQLSARREIYRWSLAKKVRFFKSDPFDTLAHSVAAALANSPLSESELKLRLESLHRGFSDLFAQWQKGALARGEIYPYPPAKGTKSKRFGSTPDVGSLLKAVFTALRKVLATPAGKRVRKSQLLEAITAELDTAIEPRVEGTSSSDSESKPSDRETFLVHLSALALETKSEGLQPIRALRARLPFDKQRFDSVALELMRDGLVTLHHHDFPESLSTAERAELVVEPRGTHFVGIALRRTI